MLLADNVITSQLKQTTRFDTVDVCEGRTGCHSIFYNDVQELSYRRGTARQHCDTWSSSYDIYILACGYWDGNRSTLYTVSPKKYTPWRLTIILANVDRLSKLFHRLIHAKILYVYTERLPTHLQYVAIYDLVKFENPKK